MFSVYEKSGERFSCRAFRLRDFVFMVGKRVTVLHAFIKKTQQTPDNDLKLARKRLKELQNA